MKLRFLGAAGTVTGSCFYVESEKLRFLVDCGMYQGSDVSMHNLDPFEFDPTELDFVILTHAHIDHSGLIPKLFKNGFRGDVYLTPATAELASILLLDSAKIQEKDEVDGYESGKGKEKIYGTDDAIAAIDHFKSINFFEKINIGNDGDYFMFVPAGHVLGAASALVEVEGKRILFSGDIGRSDQSLIKNFLEYDYEPLKPDYIISESLYGNSTHPNRDESVSKLIEIINKTLERDGNVIIPSFSLHRTQELIEILKVANLAKLIKRNVQIYLDSPMAIGVNFVYANHPDQFNNSFKYGDIEVAYDGAKLQGSARLKFDMLNTNRIQFDEIRYIRKAKKSLKLTSKKDSIIIAGSGMAEGGRVVHHLYSSLENGKNSVIFIGYQAKDTLGRELVEGAKTVVIKEKAIKVKSEMYYLRGFSAHADREDLLAWLKMNTSNSLKKVFLIHSEPLVAEEFGENLRAKGYNVEIPVINQEFIL